MWIRRSRNSPLGKQLYEGIRQAILTGELAPRAALPSTRALAAAEGIARNTALRVYRQLNDEGYLITERGRRTRVAPDLPVDLEALLRPRPERALVPRKRALLSERSMRLEQLSPSWRGPDRSLPYDFRYGRPSSDFPFGTWKRMIFRCARELSVERLDYSDPAGLPELRELISAYLRQTRGVVCESDQIVIVNGTQQAMCLAAELLLDPGDLVLVEEPGYAGAQTVFRAAGAKLIPAPVGPEGLAIGALDGRTIRGVQLAYVTPSHQFPTGAVLSLAHRLALLEWAAKHGAWIFEDDYDSEFRFDAPPVESLQGLDRGGSVLYAGSFSKVLFPALRIGYLVVPRPLLERVRIAKAVADTGTSRLEHHALAAFWKGGHFERHVRRTRTNNGRRRAALIDALGTNLGGHVEVLGANAGLHVMLRFPGIPVGREAQLVARAAEVGVGVYSPDSFYSSPRVEENASLLLGYSSLSPETIDLGIARLASVIRDLEGHRRTGLSSP